MDIEYQLKWRTCMVANLQGHPEYTMEHSHHRSTSRHRFTTMNKIHPGKIFKEVADVKMLFSPVKTNFNHQQINRFTNDEPNEMN